MERTIRFGLLLNTAEKQALTRLAETEGGLSQGAMLRNLIRTEARKRGLLPPADQQKKAKARIGQEVNHDT